MGSAPLQKAPCLGKGDIFQIKSGLGHLAHSLCQKQQLPLVLRSLPNTMMPGEATPLPESLTT